MSALLVAGTTSDAGKTTVVTGLCRWLARRGVRVAPFKAQNMSNNSMVCADGAEIGRAQWIQAVAAGAEPESAMNPVLLKPGSDLRSHVVLRGKPWGELSATDFPTRRGELAEAAFAAYDELAARYDVVVCEGAGSPTEINLRRSDYVNLGLARHADIPVVVVGDIDRGGVFASMFGTVALLDAADQRLIAGFVVNKFRGDRSLLQPGLEMLRKVTGRRTFGVLPWLPDLWLDSEDTLDVPTRRAPEPVPVPGPVPAGSGSGSAVSSRTSGSVLSGTSGVGSAGSGVGTSGTSGTSGSAGSGSGVLTVAVVRFPRISNFTDLDALAVEPTTSVIFTVDPVEVRDADLVVLPGSRATVADLGWLRSTGLADVVTARVLAGRPVLGICGGYQVLGATIDDPAGVETGGSHAGLGLLPVATVFSAEKVLGRPAPTAYEIHHGVVSVAGDATAFPGGCRTASTWGTIWHGLFDDDATRRAFLTEVAALTGKAAPDRVVSFAARREDRLDRLADAVDEYLDTEALLDLIESGTPPALPFIPPGAPPS